MALNGSMLGLGFVVSAKDATQHVWRGVRSGMSAVRQEAKQTMDVLGRVARVAAKDVGWMARSAGRPGGGDEGGARYRDKNGRMREANGRFMSGGGRGMFGGKGGGMDLFTGQLGRYIGAGAIVRGMQGMVGAAADFEKEMAAVQAISHASAADFTKLKVAAFASFKEGFSPIQAAKALQDLASAGYGANDSLKMLRPTMLLAGASMGQLGGDKAAGLLSATLKAFQLNTKDSEQVVNQLVQTMNLFSVQAKDLPLGLANVSRGAIAMKQNLAESMASFGLARNIIPRVESAASAVSRAMERMVDPKVQKALKGMGVEVATSDGRFRNFLDIITDLTPELDKMTDVKKSAFLQKTFGKASLAGLSAIMQQLAKGQETVNGKILRGKDLVEALRAQYEDTNAAAAYFKEVMMSTLSGQGQRLKATGEALAIALGDPIAAVIKPIVAGIVDSFTSFTEYIATASANVKMLIAGIVLGVGALAASLLAFGGPVTLVLGGIALAFYGIKTAITENIGGAGDAFFSAIDRIKLAFQGLVQLFGDGAFSGNVMVELARAKNGGLKQFLIDIYVWVERVRNFFRGLGQGISQGLEIAGPTFQAFGNALDRLLVTLGLTSENDPASNISKWEKWGKTGESIGKMIAGALEWVVSGLIHVIDFGDGFFSKWDGAKTTFSAVSDAATNLAFALGLLTPPSPGESTNGWRTFGKVLGWISDSVLTTMGNNLRSLSQTVSGALTHLGGLWDIFTGLLMGDFGRVWDGIKKAFAGGIQFILSILGMAVGEVARAIDLFNEITPGRAKTNHRATVGKFFQEMHSGIDSELGQGEGAVRQGTTTVSSPKDELAQIRASERSMRDAALGAAAASAMPFGLAGMATGLLAQQAPANKQVTILKPSFRATLMVDGQELSTRLKELEQENDHREGGSDGIDGL